jgi:YHS domain-containing protein
MKIILLFSLFVLTLIQADEIALRQKHFNTEENLAISGYDPVSYFKGKPVEGEESLVYTFKGINYYFSSKENLETFKSNPSSYEPVFGGWCAYAMANGEKVEVDPETFKLINGKLYLFYNFYFNNTLKKWNEKEAGLKSKAEVNWTKIFK